MAEGIAERYDERIAGVLSCYDRIIISGTLPGICYAKGMTAFLRANGIRIFDYPQFAANLRDAVRENAAKIAEAAGVSIEHVAKSHIRKETNFSADVSCVTASRCGFPFWDRRSLADAHARRQYVPCEANVVLTAQA